MNIYDHKQKWQRRENESPNGAAYYSGGLFSEATCDPIVRLSHASPHQTRSQLKCSSPACQGAKTKYINSGKQISSVTLIWPQKPPSYGDAALAVWSVTPGDSKQTFRTSKKKKKKCFVSAFDKILYPAPPPHFCAFVLFSNRPFSIFHQLVFTKRLARCDSTLRRWRDSLAGPPPPEETRH